MIGVHNVCYTSKIQQTTRQINGSESVNNIHIVTAMKTTHFAYLYFARLKNICLATYFGDMSKLADSIFP